MVNIFYTRTFSPEDRDSVQSQPVLNATVCERHLDAMEQDIARNGMYILQQTPATGRRPCRKCMGG